VGLVNYLGSIRRRTYEVQEYVWFVVLIERTASDSIGNLNHQMAWATFANFVFPLIKFSHISAHNVIIGT
jgi:hypothetical protein